MSVQGAHELPPKNRTSISTPKPSSLNRLSPRTTVIVSVCPWPSVDAQPYRSQRQGSRLPEARIDLREKVPDRPERPSSDAGFEATVRLGARFPPVAEQSRTDAQD